MIEEAGELIWELGGWVFDLVVAPLLPDPPKSEGLARGPELPLADVEYHEQADPPRLSQG